mmetsp:Transcript_26251/g.69976  ORF Transcript_26251/g.69976 Transcript_26251/m.69976 type:complete len:257 (+) Transcript_26251:108-878(+)
MLTRMSLDTARSSSVPESGSAWPIRRSPFPRPAYRARRVAWGQTEAPDQARLLPRSGDGGVGYIPQRGGVGGVGGLMTMRESETEVHYLSTRFKAEHDALLQRLTDALRREEVQFEARNANAAKVSVDYGVHACFHVHGPGTGMGVCGARAGEGVCPDGTEVSATLAGRYTEVLAEFEDMRDTLVMRQSLEAMALYASHSRRSADGSAAMLQVSFPEGAMEGVVKRQLYENQQLPPMPQLPHTHSSAEATAATQAH